MEIVLVEPQIPQNTGSIARTCAATDTPLHLIKPYPFEISEKQVRRAGLDYWPHVVLKEHENWADFCQSRDTNGMWFLSTHGSIDYWDAKFQYADILVFGSETKGLGDSFLSKIPKERLLKIPMVNRNVRSLNLSNAVSIVLYEAKRQVELSGVLNSVL